MPNLCTSLLEAGQNFDISDWEEEVNYSFGLGELDNGISIPGYYIDHCQQVGMVSCFF